MNRTAARRRTGALALACLVPAAVVAPAAASTPETGTLTLTVFEDRYPDARFDTGLTTAAGDADRLRTDGGYVYLQDAAGAWFATGPETSGEYVFDGIALGEATIHLPDPSTTESVAYFVSGADGATTTTHGEVSFSGGTFLFPGSDQRLAWSGPSRLGGQGTVTVGTSSTALVGLTAVGASAQVLGVDGAPVADQADVTFVANDERIDGTLVADGVTYYPGTRRLVPDTVGVEVVPAAGLVVAGVTARSSISGAPLAVTLQDGTWVVDVTGLATYFDRADITVQLAAPPASAAECKDGGWAVSRQPVFRNQGACVAFFAAPGGRG